MSFSAAFAGEKVISDERKPVDVTEEGCDGRRTPDVVSVSGNVPSKGPLLVPSLRRRNAFGRGYLAGVKSVNIRARTAFSRFFAREYKKLLEKV